MAKRWLPVKKSNNVNDLLENQKQLENRIHYQEDLTAKLERQNGELKREVAILTAEKNELLSRLSRFAGEQMSRGNPDIADLSDPNRPTKLAEKWTSLYTEEWLDAYEELQHVQSRKRQSQTQPIEKQLLSIAVLCYHQCQKTANEQILKLKYTLEDLESYMQDTSTDLTQSRRISSAKLDRGKGVKFVDNVINSYRQRRRSDQGWIEAIKKKCANEYIKDGVHSKRVLSYVNKCAELCWYMCVNDPTMVIEYESYPGQEIDRNKFNLYNGKGNVVDFVVWPALFLNRGDSYSILAKGTVQPVMPQKTPTKQLAKRKSSDKIDDIVSPVSIHKKDTRATSAASMRSSTKQNTPMKSSLKHSSSASVIVHDNNAMAFNDLKSTAASIRQQPSSSSRIANPERLLSSKPLIEPNAVKNKRGNLFKSVRGKHTIAQCS